MRTNNFTTNMKNKSNKELERIFNEKSNYTEEAIQAVTWELENRNLIERTADLTEETNKNINLIEDTLSNKTINSNESPFEELVLPYLYSKKAIQGFTVFFTTIFGAVLLMKNLKDLNKPKARIQVLVFGILYTLLSVVLLNYLPKTFFITLLFNIVGYAVLVEFYWNKNLGKDLEYKKKPIWKPLATSMFILMALALLQFLPQILAS